jgi:[histone H3]-lysine36 N-dimethyltransferase SETMAR
LYNNLNKIIKDISVLCCQVLRRDLVQALRKKRPDLDLASVLLHQDNAPAHRASSTSLEIDLLDFETIVHPPYSPDLAPMDFSIFPEIKRQLRGLRFESAIDLSLKVRSIVASFPESWYVSVFDQWIRRHEKCVIREGDYVEK